MESPGGAPTVRDCMSSFEPYLAANRNTRDTVFHVSLNPHPKDILTDEELVVIAGEYMRQMGYGNQPYIIFRHEDIGRPHLHIVSLRVDSSGRKINDFQERKRSTALCRKLERKYGLHPVLSEPYRKCETLTAVDPLKPDLKRQITCVVRPVMEDYHFQSLKEYKALLGLFNVTVEEVSKEIAGKTYRGIIYAATDRDGRRTGVGVKSSKIGKSVGYRALQQKFAASKKWMKKHPVTETCEENIRLALQETDKERFLQRLNGKGSNAVLFQNDAGRIYGVTYIDHNSRCVFKGSSLGKEFSAAILNERYGMVVQDDGNCQEERQDFMREEFDPYETGLAEGVLNLLTPESYPYPGEDNPESPYGKKKRKKRRGQHIR